MKHLLSLEETSANEMRDILAGAKAFKSGRTTHPKPLAGQTWALLFSKSSTRTRVSFEVGIHELGGNAIFLNSNDIQLGRGEPIRDTARVLGRLLHGAIIRTYAQSDVEEFARYSNIPTVNALTDEEHPCQVLADIFTYEEKRGPIRGKVVSFIGDGFSNMAVSWMFAATKLGFELRIGAPRNYQPSGNLLDRVLGANSAAIQSPAGALDASQAKGRITVTDDLKAACQEADLLYTDVWISMGKESESKQRLKELSGYQINAEAARFAKPTALVMHCLPAYRGKEIDEETFEAHAPTIFDQVENRLHVQKGILDWLVSK